MRFENKPTISNALIVNLSKSFLRRSSFEKTFGKVCEIVDLFFKNTLFATTVIL